MPEFDPDLVHEFADTVNSELRVDGLRALTDDDASEILAALRQAGFTISHPAFLNHR